MVKRIPRLPGLVVLLIALVAGATGCGTTMRDLPIPGTGVSGDTIDVVAEFDDALNLAQGAPVKVNGVDSGKVADIAVEDFIAKVTLTLRKDAELRDGATARLRYTTPLGELFVDITNPAQGTLLADEAVLTQQSTATAPTVENALSSASLLINGGGLEQLQTVTQELNTILVGNEGQIKTLLRNANSFLSQANQTTQSIDRVLNSMNSVSSTLAAREELFNRVIKDIRPAARVLRKTTPDFTKLLREVERFSGVANDTIGSTRTQLLSLLSEVQPVLAELSSNRNRMNTMLQEIAKAGDVLETIINSDYAPLRVDLDVAGLGIEGGVGGTLGGLIGLLGLDDLADDLGLNPDELLGGDIGGLPLGRTTQSDPAGLGTLVNGGGN